MQFPTQPTRNFFKKIQRGIVITAFQTANIALLDANFVRQFLLRQILFGTNLDGGSITLTMSTGWYIGLTMKFAKSYSAAVTMTDDYIVSIIAAEPDFYSIALAY